MLKEKTYLFAKCKECGRTWNISVFQQIPSNGYICPYCRGKAKKEQRKIRNKMAAGAVKYLILTLTGIILFHITAEAAYIERGYRAYGGECLLLLLPLIWYAIETTVHDTIKEAKKLNPVELLAVADFVNTCGRFTAKDLKFMNSCIGQRCERLLRNVVNKFTWND